LLLDVVRDAVVHLVTILDIEVGASDVAHHILGDSGEVCAVDDYTALVGILNCVSFQDAVRTRLDEVKVHAIFTHDASLSTFLHSDVSHVQRASNT
jgi:hypothetical protein